MALPLLSLEERLAAEDVAHEMAAWMDVHGEAIAKLIWRQLPYEMRQERRITAIQTWKMLAQWIVEDYLNGWSSEIECPCGYCDNGSVTIETAPQGSATEYPVEVSVPCDCVKFAAGDIGADEYWSNRLNWGHRGYLLHNGLWPRKD